MCFSDAEIKLYFHAVILRQTAPGRPPEYLIGPHRAVEAHCKTRSYQEQNPEVQTRADDCKWKKQQGPLYYLWLVDLELAFMIIISWCRLQQTGRDFAA